MSDSVRPHPWDSPGKNTGVGCHFLLQCIKVKSESEVTQSCPTLRNPMDCSLPGSSVHGIFQARILEWGAIAFSVLVLYSQIISCTVAICTYTTWMLPKATSSSLKPKTRLWFSLRQGSRWAGTSAGAQIQDGSSSSDVWLLRGMVSRQGGRLSPVAGR